MRKIAHKLLNHQIDPSAETLIIGTFNPPILKKTTLIFFTVEVKIICGLYFQ